MLLLRLWNYIRGYVIIIVKGYFLEKFINICTRRQILLWDLKRQKENVVTMKISINGFRLLRPIAKKSGCNVRIMTKKGLPFLLHRYRKRKAFVAGAVVFVALMYVMTSFVWIVEINGNDELDRAYLEETLSSLGVKPGAFKYTIDTKKTVTDMLIAIKKLSWISLEVKGTKVKVDLRERIEPPEQVPKDKPCDIVAVKDGIVKRIIARDGLEVVNTGDTVRKGQVLITGRIPVKNEKDVFRLVHAIGSVQARTWYEVVRPIEMQAIERVKTGKSYRDYTLVLFTKKLGLLQNTERYAEYEVEENVKNLSLGVDMVFPFGLVVKSYYEVERVTYNLTQEEAKIKTERELQEELEKLLPKDVGIVSRKLIFKDDEIDGLKGVLRVECLEDIGIERDMEDIN